VTGPEAATHQELLAALDNFANLDGQLQGFIEIGEGAAMFEVSEQPGPQQSSEADSLSTVEQEDSQASLITSHSRSKHSRSLSAILIRQSIY